MPTNPKSTASSVEAQTAAELCGVCGKPLVFPTDDDPEFEGDTVVTSKCRHTVRKRSASPKGLPEARCLMMEGQRKMQARNEAWVDILSDPDSLREAFDIGFDKGWEAASVQAVSGDGLVERITVYIESESDCLMPIVVEETKKAYGVRLLKVMADEIRQKFSGGDGNLVNQVKRRWPSLVEDLVSAATRVWRKYGHDEQMAELDWVEWTDVRDALAALRSAAPSVSNQGVEKELPALDITHDDCINAEKRQEAMGAEFETRAERDAVEALTCRERQLRSALAKLEGDMGNRKAAENGIR